MRNHYELECWIKPTKNVSRVVSPSVLTGKHERHRVAIPRRADHETPRELPTMLPEEFQIRCEDKIEEHNCEDEIEKDEIEKHKVHIPRQTEYRYQSKSKSDFRRRKRLEVFTVLQFDSAIDMQQGQPHFDLMIGTDKSTGAVWASAVLPLIEKEGKKDPYIILPILSCLSELGYSKVIIQSDGESASEVVLRMVQSKGARMENPPCEIVQRQLQQIKAYKIQSEMNSRITIRDDSSLLTWLPRHAAWQYMRFRKQQDSTTVFEKISHILLVGEAVASYETSRWTQNLDYVPSVRRQYTRYECWQVLRQGRRSLRYIYQKWWYSMARRSKRN